MPEIATPAAAMSSRMSGSMVRMTRAKAPAARVGGTPGRCNGRLHRTDRVRYSAPPPMQSITQIKPSTQVCAVIGNPVAHSMSPAIHNRAFAELGLDYVYVAFRVEDVRAAVTGMRALNNFRGLSVTIPHKVSIIRYLDEVAEVDRGIGSVNTVVND